MAGCRRLLSALGAALLLLPALAPAQETQPLLVVETGSHSAPLRRIDVRRGIVVTASDDRTARVWDQASGELRQVLRPLAQGAEVGRLYGVAIHPNEPLVAVAGTTGGGALPHVIYLFDLDSGALRGTIDAKAGDIRKLAWAADGSVLLAGYSGTNGVRAFARDGRELLDDRFDGPVFGLAVGAGGRAAAVGLDGQLRSYRVGNGSVQRLAAVALGARRSAGVAFSPDGRQLAVAYATRGEGPELFDADSLQSLARLPAAPSYGGDFRVVAWSADGRTLALGGTAYSRELRFPVVQYDVAARRLAGQVDVAGDSVTDLLALPSGELAYASFDGSWGVVAGGQPRAVGAAVTTVRGDAPLDLQISADATALRWATRNVERGGLAFAFDRRRVGAAVPNQGLREPETRFGFFSAPSDWINDSRPPVIGGKPLALAADERGRALVVARGTPAAAIVGTNRALYRVAENGQVTWRVPVDTEIRAVNSSADGRLLVTAMADGTLRWWRGSDGRLLLTLLARADGRWVVWTPSGYFDASAGADRLVGWALPRGALQPMGYFSLGRFRERFNRPDVIDAVLQTLDEPAAFARIAERDEQTRLALQRETERQAAAAVAAQRDAATRADAARLAVQREEEQRAAAQRAEREALASAEAARAAEQRRLAARAQAERETTEREAARLADIARVAAERERVEREAALEAQRLTARLEAERQQARRDADERERAARETARENEMRIASDQARKALAALKAVEFPPALQNVATSRIRTTAASVTLPFSLSAPQGAGEVAIEVRVAGRPTQPAEVVMPRAFNGQAQGFARIDDVGAGITVIEIIAGNRYGLSEPLAFTIEREALARPPAGNEGDLYVLAIGIADYQRTEYKLGLAAKDASDFGAAMKRQEGRQYRRVVVHTLTNADATKVAVLRELAWLRGAVGAGDTAMLFLAGHGVNDSAGQYFFMPYDAHHERLLATAVPQAAIVSTLGQVRGRTLAFIDTCFAGNALGALYRTAKKTERFVNDLSASENGVIVFASSTGHEESLEQESWGNGAFTKALLEGLAGKADFMRAGRVTYAGLNLFVSEEVTRLTDGRQRPVFISPRGVPDFAVVRL